jgi:hypothetical protein
LGAGLVAAALGSIAANGLACGLIVFAAHPRKKATAAPEVVLPAPEQAQYVQRFALDRLYPAKRDTTVDLAAIRSDFRRWCELRQIPPPAGADLGQALGDLFDRLGIAIEQRDGRWVALGIQLADHLLPAPIAS